MTSNRIGLLLNAAPTHECQSPKHRLMAYLSERSSSLAGFIFVPANELPHPTADLERLQAMYRFAFEQAKRRAEAAK